MVSRATLEKQNYETTAAVIGAFAQHPSFAAYAQRVAEQIRGRDREDEERLARGIQFAVDKQVLPAVARAQPVCRIDMEGRSVDDVCDEILDALGQAPSRGCVVTFQGLSGIGKGTIVASLQQLLPSCSTWSNGNVFRSLTLLAVMDAERKRCTLEEVLTPELLGSYIGMLHLVDDNGKFDIQINGMGVSLRVSEIVNTKFQAISSWIPTVAECAQGEVVIFTRQVLDTMARSGQTVLVEGRGSTLDHIETPHRFELVLQSPDLVGMRRAAQELAGLAREELQLREAVSGEAVHAALERALVKCLARVA